MAERLNRIFSAFTFNTETGEQVRATISLGVAELSQSDDAESLFGKADQALYKAKNSGRNQVVCAS